jgi:hypothetical protein
MDYEEKEEEVEEDHEMQKFLFLITHHQLFIHKVCK